MCKGGGRGAGGLSTGGAVLSVRVSLLVWAFGVAKDTDGEVFDVGGPLRRQLEKLDIVPLDAVDGDCREEQRDVSERRDDSQSGKQDRAQKNNAEQQDWVFKMDE